MKRRVIITACCSLLLAPAAIARSQATAAQPSRADEGSQALRRSFGQVSAWVTRAAELVPADKYTYRPAPSVRTFGELIAHMADGYAYYCAAATRANVEWSDAIEKGKTDKATVQAKLAQALRTCNSAYASAPNGRALIENFGHTNLHYGNVITYMRMLGLVPPSS